MSESERAVGGDLDSRRFESLRDLLVLGFSLEGLLCAVERAYLGEVPGTIWSSSSTSSKYATEGADFFAMPGDSGRLGLISESSHWIRVRRRGRGDRPQKAERSCPGTQRKWVSECVMRGSTCDYGYDYCTVLIMVKWTRLFEESGREKVSNMYVCMLYVGCRPGCKETETS